MMKGEAAPKGPRQTPMSKRSIAKHSPTGTEVHNRMPDSSKEPVWPHIYQHRRSEFCEFTGPGPSSGHGAGPGPGPTRSLLDGQIVRCIQGREGCGQYMSGWGCGVLVPGRSSV